jgi:hypothetical protein
MVNYFSILKGIIKTLGNGWRGYIVNSLEDIPCYILNVYQKKGFYLKRCNKDIQIISKINQPTVLEFWESNLFILDVAISSQEDAYYTLLKASRYAIRFLTKPTSWLLAVNIHTSLCSENVNSDVTFAPPVIIDNTSSKLTLYYQGKPWLGIVLENLAKNQFCAIVVVLEDLVPWLQIKEVCVGTPREVVCFTLDNILDNIPKKEKEI